MVVGNPVSSAWSPNQASLMGFRSINFEILKLTGTSLWYKKNPANTMAELERFKSFTHRVRDLVQYELSSITGESYSDLDRLGRCGQAVAMIDKSLMPTEERGSIGQVKPSGWNQEKYPGIVDSEPPYLYNRCHLIAYGLTGENANEKNLITGTRYFNASGMLPFELTVMNYLDDSENHVLYRITPYFKGNELVARGVEMEAYSVEDRGAGVCFHVFVYNVQPGIELDLN